MRPIDPTVPIMYFQGGEWKETEGSKNRRAQRMTSEEFVSKNRAKIDKAIIRRHGMSKGVNISDDERELWVLNDEDLYRWAVAEGMEE